MNDTAHRTNMHSDASSQDSVPMLLRRLVTDVMNLVSTEFALARREFVEDIVAARHALATASLAAALVLAGTLAVMAGVVLLLVRWLPPWLAAMGVGIVLAAAGLLLLRRVQGRVGLENLGLTRTRRSVQSDIGVVTRRGT